MCVKERVCKSVGNISLSLSLSPSLSLSLSLSVNSSVGGKRCPRCASPSSVSWRCWAILHTLSAFLSSALPFWSSWDARCFSLLALCKILAACLVTSAPTCVLFCFVTTTTSQSQCTGRHLHRACLKIWKNAWRCWKIAPRLAPSPLQNGFLRWGWEGLTPSVEGEEADNPCVSKTMEPPPVSRPIPEKPSASNPTMTTRDSAPAAN
jgi:hypothetical protein